MKSKHRKQKEPLELLISLLVRGGRVTHGGVEYAMDINGSLCSVMRAGNGHEHPIKIDCDLSAAKKLADDIGREELWIKCCELEIN